MAPRGSVAAVWGAVAFVFVSSWLGLTGRFFLFDPVGSAAMFASIWRSSLVADGVFVGGSVLSAVIGFAAARQHLALGGFFAGMGSWLTYAASFLLLGSDVKGTIAEAGIGGALRFTGTWGIVGLVFCALAPPVAAWWWERAGRPKDT